MQDQLFRPTIRDRRPGRPPWRPESILYPAVLGGPLAAATLGVLNGRRLALPTGQLVAIAAAGVAAFGGRLAVSGSIEANAGVRLVGSIAGLVVWLLVVLLQRKPFRVRLHRGDEPASLIRPGVLAFLGCGLLEAALIEVLVR